LKYCDIILRLYPPSLTKEEDVLKEAMPFSQVSDIPRVCMGRFSSKYPTVIFL